MENRRIVITGEGRVSKEFVRFARQQSDTIITMVTHRQCDDQDIPDSDVLIHAGARVFADQSVSDPGPYVTDNVGGTFAMLEFARRRKCPLFVYISTYEAADPRSPYAATKAAGEDLTRAWGASYGMKWLIVRLPNLFIPDYSDKGVVGRLLRCEIKEVRQKNRLRKWLDGPDFAEQLWNVMQGETNRLVTLDGKFYTDQDIADRVEGWKVQVHV